MRFSIKNKKQTIGLCLAILLAINVFLWAAVPARAEEDDVLSTTNVTESAESGEEEGTAAETPEAERAETVPDELDAEALLETAPFEEAKAVLLSVLDQDGEYAQSIEELLPEEPYLRKDFVAAMEKCASTISLVKNLDVQLEQMEEKLYESALTEELRETYWNALERERAVLDFEPMTELMEALQVLKSDPSETIFLNKTATLQAEAETLSKKVDHLGGTLGHYEYLVHTFDSDTGSLTAQNPETVVLTRLEELTSRRDALKTEAESFFSLTEAAQASLPDRIEQLQEDTAAFLLSVDALNYGKQVNSHVKTLDKSNANVMTLAVIGIAVAVVAMVIAIVATVYAVRAASKEPEIDLSGVVSKDDLRSLADAFNGEMNQMDQKIQQCQVKQMGDIELRLKQLWDAVNSSKQVSPIPDPPPLDLPHQPERRPISSLRLKYQDLAPANSSLIPDETGDLILYDDMTVGLKTEPQKRANDMRNWQSEGVLYLFNPQVDGREYAAGQGTFPAGYYIIDHVERTARVSPIGSSYKLESKGCIVMKKI